MNSFGKRIGAAVVVLGIVLGAVFGLQRQENLQETKNIYTKDLFAMDTYFTLKAYGPQGEEALEKCEDKVRELESLLSVTKEDSDIRKLNAEENCLVSEDTFHAIQQALDICRETDGALDITLYPVLKKWGFTTDTYCVPDREEIQGLLANVDYQKVATDIAGYAVLIPSGAALDLGAVAKGYTGDCLLEILKQSGVESALLDLGGNVQTLGSRPDGSPWRVAVRNPLEESRELGILEINDKCVITSGSYERYFEQDGKRYWHILDPADGYPADSGLISVTIVGEKGIRCDGLSTALFVMGKEKAVDFWRQKGDFEMILVTGEKELYITEGLQECFECSEEWDAEILLKE